MQNVEVGMFKRAQALHVVEKGGGEVLSWVASKTDSKRKIFRFRAMRECVGFKTSKLGWSNEKKIEWVV
jgi:hypothetical protein